MRYVSFERTGRISRIGLGTWQFGASEWGYGEQYAEQGARVIVRRALELGVTLFDTAESYSSGRSERILGRALGDARERVFLATKVMPLVPSALVIEQRALASADRLGVRTLPLYQVHRPNPVAHDVGVMRGMRLLQRVGLVGEIGVSNYSLARWRSAERALGGRVLSNQVRYNLLARDPEDELLPYAEAQRRLVIAYSPLAQGLLSGRYGPDRRPGNRVRAGHPTFRPENLDRTAGLVATVRDVAAAYDATPAQVALAWVLRRPAVVAIAGASGVGQLEENVAAADLDLADDACAVLDAASDRLREEESPSARRRPLAEARNWARAARHVARTARHDRLLDRDDAPARDGPGSPTL